MDSNIRNDLFTKLDDYPNILFFENHPVILVMWYIWLDIFSLVL